MRWREVFSKQTIVSLVIILGLTVFGIAYLSIRPGSRSLHPEEAKVEACAEWEDYPALGPDRLLMEITLVELDVNDTYCFLEIGLFSKSDNSVDTGMLLTVNYLIADSNLYLFNS